MDTLVILGCVAILAYFGTCAWIVLSGLYDQRKEKKRATTQTKP